MYLMIGSRTLRQYRRFSSLSDQVGKKDNFGGYDRETFIAICERVSPFIRNVLKPKVIAVGKGTLTLELPPNEDFVGNPTVPCYHGGVAASIIDHSGGFCAWTTIKDTSTLTSTVDLKIDYIRPAPVETLFCDAICTHQGRSLIRMYEVHDLILFIRSVDNISSFLFSDTVLWNNDRSKKIALGRQTMNVYKNDVKMEDKYYEAKESLGL